MAAVVDEARNRRRCVLDIETAPDPHAVTLAGRRGRPASGQLREIVAASMLTFVEEAGGGYADFALASVDRSSSEERSMLRSIEAVLADVAVDGVLVTFNGRAFDLPVLRMRQLRWWLFAAAAVPAIAADPARHVDVMLELSLDGAGRWPTLADACASVGFCLAAPARAHVADTPPVEVEKCERDVVATAILYFYVLAGRRADATPLLAGLPALGRFLRGPGCGGGHLHRFARSDLLSEPKAWGATTGDPAPLA